VGARVSPPLAACRLGAIVSVLLAALAATGAARGAQWPEPLPLGRESMYADLNQGTIADADRLLDDTWPARGHPPVRLGWPLTWTEDPYRDAYWRFMFYSLRYTSHLLWAYGTTGDRRYLDKLVAILRSYAAHDERRSFDRLRFDNNHAAAYRAMVLVNTFEKLRRWGELPADLEAGLRASIERLGSFLLDPRRFEPGFNHGFTQAAALLLVADTFPELPGAAGWRATALERLEGMIASNLDEDGIDIENSPFYHYYVLGMVTQIARWANAHEPALAPSYEAAQRAMLPYAAAIVQPDGRLPMLGATATTIVPNQDPAVYGPLAELDPAFAWVFTDGAAGTPPPPGVRLFPASGLFLLRASPTADRASRTFITFDSGPYRTDHSHLDALSLTYYSSGAALLPDSGLFTYDPGPSYDYFHGTRSHNTVAVDGLDQAEGAAVPGASGVAAGVSWATGTSDLYSGVRHVRTVALLEQDLAVVVDSLTSAGPHDYEQTWHFHPETSIRFYGRNVVAFGAADRPVLTVAQADWSGLTFGTDRGATHPIQGWWSNAYGAKSPSWAVEYRRRAASARFVTLLASGPYAGRSAYVRQAWVAGQNRRRVWVCAPPVSYTLTLVAQGSVGERLEVERGSGCIEYEGE
jgi:hypothetical protein